MSELTGVVGSRRRPQWLKACAALAVSGLLVSLVASQLELGALPARLVGLRWGWLGVLALCSFGVLVLRGLRFWLLTPRSAPFVVTAAVALQNLLNKVTPLRLGELALPYYLARHGDEPVGRALLLLVQVRLMELWTLLGAALVASWAVLPAEGGARLAGMALALALLTGVLVAFRPLSSAAAQVIRGMVARTPLRRLARLVHALNKLEAAIDAGTGLSGRQWAGLAVTTLGVLALNYVLFACIFLAFGIELPASVIVIGASIGQAGALVPITTVGSFGTLEGAWVAGFVLLGVSPADAALTALAAQLLPLAMAGMFAVPAYVYLSLRDPHRER